MEYSIIIRTTGKAGEKYRILLDSISNLNIQPKDIIVVLPEGYDIPSEKIGTEKYYFCPKGMVRQRMYGVEKCDTKYALVTDDDICFSPDFIEKVSPPVVEGNYGASSGPLTEFFPSKGLISLISFLTASAVPTVFHKNRYNSLLLTTGYSYNRNIDINNRRFYETQTAPWTCFFVDIDKLNAIHFNDESWLDLHGYSAHDDTVMFYKMWLYGYKSVIVSDAEYRHLDAKTSSKGISDTVAFAMNFNTYVLWKRFIYDNGSIFKKIGASICFNYSYFLSMIISRFKSDKKIYSAKREGHKAAKKFVKSNDYLNMPPVVY